MFMLDANAWIALFRGQIASLLAEIKRHPATEIVLCSVVLAELQYGVCCSRLSILGRVLAGSQPET